MKQHILIVDDESPIRGLLQTYFNRNGYQVSAAGTPGEMFASLEAELPDVILLDVLLGDADGLELLTMIKAKNPSLPVIIMTGIGFDQELVNEALVRGASSYVSKTLPLDKLLLEVQSSGGVR